MRLDDTTEIHFLFNAPLDKIRSDNSFIYV